MTIYINQHDFHGKKSRKKITPGNFEIDRLPIISKDLIQFLRKDKKKRQNSFIQWNIAMRRGGKTGLTFMEINQLLPGNPKRFIQFFKVPELITKIIYEKLREYDQKHHTALFDEYHGRFECIDKIRKIKQNAIVIIDEGLIGANAKEALKIGMRNLGKYLSKSRHPNNIILINSVNLNILSEFRDMIDISIYKRVGSKFIFNNAGRDPILDMLESKLNEKGLSLSRLRPQQGFLFSDYWGFEVIGAFHLDLNDYCPWFHDDISRYHQHTNPDVAFDEEQKRLDELDKLAKQIIDEVGEIFSKRGGKNDFEVWLERNHPGIAYDYKADISKLYKRYCYFLKYSSSNESDILYEEEQEQSKIDFKEQESFADFCLRNISKITDPQYSPQEVDQIAKVAHGLARGDSYRDIDANYPNIGYHFVRTTAKWLRSQANTVYGLGYLFERWMAYNLGVPEGKIEEVVGSTTNGPDLIWDNKIWTFKFRISKNEKSFIFRQSLDFTPEYNLAKKKGRHYYLAFMDPKWSLKVDVQEIDPINDPEEIKVEAPSESLPKLVM
jgi:hypothetical protein